MLSQVETRVDWDDTNRREVEEAKTLYQEARAEGRKVLDHAGRIVEAFSARLKTLIILPNEMNEHEWSLRILDETGDSRIVWDKRNKKEVLEAQNLFNEHLAKGGKIYAVDSRGRKGQRIYGFHGDHEEVVIDERGTREKLSSFASKWGKNFTALPRTYPG